MKYMPWVAFAISVVFTLILTPIIQRLAERFGAVAVPRARDIHAKPLPRWGGLAMVGAFLATMALVFIWGLVRHAYLKHDALPWSEPQMLKMAGLALAIVVITVIGAVDDKWDVSAKIQTLGLLGAGLILFLTGIRIDGVTNFFQPGPAVIAHQYNPAKWHAFIPAVSAAATMIWVFGVAKTVDFIDGLDGLAAGVGAICAVTLAVMSAAASAQTGQYEVTILAAGLVGVCVGFLRYNWHPSSIIMGTVGAQFIGLMLATISVLGTMKIAVTLGVVLPLVVLAVPVGDGIRVVLKRLINRVPAYVPDKTSHIHHWLINQGLSQPKAVAVIYGLTACFCALALFLSHL